MLSLYVHIPFCRSKCAYCDFYSLPVAGHDLTAYVDLLLRQLDGYRHDPRWSGPADTLFLGGGTPSLLPPEQVRRLIDACREFPGLTADAEISLEANPDTVTPASLAGYRQAGVNRLSFGVQTLDDGLLRLLERPHDARTAAGAIRAAAAAGFTNLGLDLIFALPGQTLAQLEQVVATVLEWPLQHLSCYGLTFEPGTPLHQRRTAGAVAEVDEDAFARQFLWLHRRLERAGFAHYEISNYARRGHACRHNLGYWQRHPCLGLGAGAHSFSARGWGERWAAPPKLAAWEVEVAAGRDPQRLLEAFDRDGALAETCYLALRTAAGIELAALQERFGIELAQAYPAAARQLGCRLRCGPQRWSLRPQDWLLYDHLVQVFL